MSSASSQKSLSFLRSIIIIRLINAFWVTTFFQPDEFFQSLEPAWDIAFGPKSGAWLTWVGRPISPNLLASWLLAAFTTND